MKMILILLSTTFLILACEAEQSPSSEAQKVTPNKSIDESTVVSTQSLKNNQNKMLDGKPVASSTPAPSKLAHQETTTSAKSMTGEQVYKNSCAGCHNTGAAKAPKLGDAVAWAPRKAKGVQALYTSAMQGVAGTAMMAKGTCSSCSDAELKSAVDYMLSKLP